MDVIRLIAITSKRCTPVAKLLYVVHRYGFPGGSEYNTQRYAEASIKIGHDVTVLAGENRGNMNGVKVTSNINILHELFDLVIVHGDCTTQNIVHSSNIQSPVYYLLIKPGTAPIIQSGMNRAKWIGCATTFDKDFVTKNGFSDKIRNVKYAVSPILPDTGHDQIIQRYGLGGHKVRYISCGGFWPHKGMDEIVTAFIDANLPNVQLILTGYDLRHGTPNYAQRGREAGIDIQVFYSQDLQDIYNLLSISNLYILNSIEEGYGIVLLEAMLHRLEWIARPVGGAPDLLYHSSNASLYTEYTKLVAEMRMRRYGDDNLRGQKYVLENHMPYDVTKNLLSVLEE
jgi:glycosyltransferase involved in cell wall biosynthesis